MCPMRLYKLTHWRHAQRNPNIHHKVVPGTCTVMEGSSGNGITNIFIPEHQMGDELRKLQDEHDEKLWKKAELKRQIETAKLRLQNKKKEIPDEKKEAFRKLSEKYNSLRDEYNALLLAETERSNDEQNN